jgi:hypothetical protein
LRRKERGNVKLFLSKKAAIIEMLEQPSRLHHQLIKFASQYSHWADVRHLGVATHNTNHSRPQSSQF